MLILLRCRRIEKRDREGKMQLKQENARPGFIPDGLPLNLLLLNLAPDKIKTGKE